MSSVWKGIQTNTGTIVAVKIYNNSMSQAPERLRKKLACEGIATKVLEHHSICKVLDVFFSEDGHNGLVMEFLDGMDLNELITRRNRKPLPVETALMIIRDVTEALDYAHNLSTYNKVVGKSYKRVLHQDIKPANIVVTQNDKVKLIDFGVSKIDSEEIEIINMGYGFTHTYAAPDLWNENEEYRGDAYEEGHDLYSLGLVFFELITGREAFKTIEQARTGNIKVLSSYGEFSTEIIDLFDKWTHKDVTKRFSTAKELSTNLSVIISKLKAPDFKIGHEVEAIRANHYSDSFCTVLETVKATAQLAGCDDVQKKLFDLMLRTNLLLNAKEVDISSELNILKELCLKLKVPHRPLQRLDDVYMKGLYDVFRETFPVHHMDWTQFKEMLNDQEILFQLLGEALPPKSAVEFYGMAKEKMIQLNFSSLGQSSTLFNLRRLMGLNSFKCDEQGVLNNYTHSLTAITVGRMLNKEGFKKESPAFLKDNFKFSPTEFDIFMKKLLSRKSSSYFKVSRIPDFVKEIIYGILIQFSNLDNDICMVERSILNDLKNSFGDQKIEIKSVKGISIPKLLEMIPSGDHIFIFSKLLELVLKKGLPTQSEKRMFSLVVNYYYKMGLFNNLDTADYHFLLEPLFKHFHKISTVKEVSKELPVWFKMDAEKLAQVIAGFNILQPIFNQNLQSDKVMASFYEYINGLRRVHQFSVKDDFLVECYININKELFLNGEFQLLYYSSSLMSGHTHQRYNGSDFVYNVIKHYLKFKYESDSFFAPTLHISPNVENEMIRIFSELKISRGHLEEAIKRIKINFNVNIDLPSFKLRQIA